MQSASRRLKRPETRDDHPWRHVVFETWIGFELPVEIIQVKEVDVLRAQVIDAQEEIAALKNKQTVQFISVRANANTTNGILSQMNFAIAVIR